MSTSFRITRPGRSFDEYCPSAILLAIAYMADVEREQPPMSSGQTGISSAQGQSRRNSKTAIEKETGRPCQRHGSPSRHRLCESSEFPGSFLYQTSMRRKLHHGPAARLPHACIFNHLGIDPASTLRLFRIA